MSPSGADRRGPRAEQVGKHQGTQRDTAGGEPGVLEERAPGLLL